MKKNEIFTFKAPNGIEVTAIVIDLISIWNNENNTEESYLCYGQNRLFTYIKHTFVGEGEMIDIDDEGYPILDNLITFEFGKVLVEYCVIPELDGFLDRYNDIEIARTETASGM